MYNEEMGFMYIVLLVIPVHIYDGTMIPVLMSSLFEIQDEFDVTCQI